jgi:glycine/D-amino acid oxidase-like deaminating enzyme/nitrite reductase/ring-hydroxylating ferredoxin subunit
MPSRSYPEGSRRSAWIPDADPPVDIPLPMDMRFDVCIVGAGVAGLTTAYLLTREGRSVAVLDDGPVCGGMTQETSAHLASAIDDRYYEVERLHGSEGARLAAESHAAAIDRIERIVRDEGIDCDFERVDGYLFLGPGDEPELLDRERAAAHRAGLKGVTRLDRVPGLGFDTGPCLLFPNQAQFHPLKYLAAVGEAIIRDGGRIFTYSHVEEVEGGRDALVRTAHHAVSADAIVVATNTPINDRLVIHTKQAPYMSYVIGARIPRGSVPAALYWDTGDPYHYVRIQRMERGDDLLIIGGEDHKTGQAEDDDERHARLERWGRERFPMMGALDYAWSGQVMETIDGLAYIGRNPLDHDNVYVVTGDSGQGLTHGTIAGMLLTDLIMGRANRWTELYDPSRKSLRAAGTYIQEAANMAAQYVDWLTGGDVDSEDEIPRNSGAVVRKGAAKLAIYRDSQGAVHRCSAVCPHLGCIVGWNTVEETWDCPCHGSRFDRFGKVINGPSNEDLARVEPP